MRVDLNCDLGESFGPYTIGNDEGMMQHISSANIACGWHGGDPVVMDRTVKMAVERGVAVGAHPSLPDLMGFGRRAMTCSAEEVEKTSKHEIFDRSAVRAVRLADPLPPLPAGFKGKWLGVHFEFQHTPGQDTRG